MSSSQRTNSIIFQRGRYTINQISLLGFSVSLGWDTCLLSPRSMVGLLAFWQGKITKSLLHYDQRMTCRPCLKTRCVTCNADYASKVAVLGHMASNITWPGFLGSSVASLLSTAQNDSCGESKPDLFLDVYSPKSW